MHIGKRSVLLIQSREDSTTATGKLDKTLLMPRKNIRRCSDQSGGGLVLGATKNDARMQQKGSNTSSNSNTRYLLLNHLQIGYEFLVSCFLFN